MNRPLKPCAMCHHGKSKHRRHSCLSTQEVLAATFMGVRRVTKWCKCEGYLEATAFDPEAPRIIASLIDEETSGGTP